MQEDSLAPLVEKKISFRNDVITKWHRPGMLGMGSAQLTDEIKRLIRLAPKDGRSDKYSGKRKSTRLQSDLWMDYCPDPPVAPVVQVTTNDISLGGMSFWMRKQVMPGTRVFLRDASDGQPHPWIPLKVTRCGPGLKGFLIGGEFEEA